jgi:DNA repair protein RadC
MDDQTTTKFVTANSEQAWHQYATTQRQIGQSLAAVAQRESENATIAKALEILEARHRPGELMDSPAAVKAWLRLRAAGMEREEFVCLWLDSQNRMIAVEVVSLGTLSQASVYPRELVRSALRLNAAAVILSHNHPSGNTKPSRADENLTSTIKSALALVDVRVLDHIVVAANEATSMAELGLI